MAKNIFMNFMLTFIWVALTGNFIYANFIFGFVLSFFILWIMARDSDDKKYFRQVPKIISFLLYFLKQMIKANLEVAYDVITPKFYMKPGIVRFPLTAKTDLEITILSNIITLTPGTFIVDVSDDKKAFYVHIMYLKDKEEYINSVKNGFERRLLEILR